jgi:beta-lactamase regulating signal transducer with metallopeptidase domain
MLIEIFKRVLLMSAAGGALGVFWLCLKPVTRKVFSPKWQYYIWLTVLIVMIIPVSFSPLKNHAYVSYEVQMQNMNADEIDAATMKAGETTAPVEIYVKPKIVVTQNVMRRMSFIWLFGAATVFGVKLIKYLAFLRAIRKNSTAEDNMQGIPKRLSVRRTHTLDAPLIVGLVKPTLYLPDMELTKIDMNYIFMHELTHYRRKDILYKWAAMLIGSVHWFNPLVYAVLKQIDLECEVSCDFEVTSNLSEAEQNNYMNMILDMMTNWRSNSRPLTTQMASGKKILKRRFEMIRNNKKTGRFVSAVSIAAAAVMLSTAVFAGGAASGLTNGRYVVTVKDAGEKLDLTNGGFVENNVTYVPLRSTLEKLGADAKIEWDNGQVYSYITEDGQERVYSIKIGSDVIGVSVNNETTKNVNLLTDEKSVPMLKNNVTYVPFNYVDYMLSSNDITLSVQDKNDAEADAKAEYEVTVGTYKAYEVQENKDVPAVFNEDNPAFVKASVEECLEKINYNLPYTYELKHKEYNAVENTVKFYVEIKPESSDSYDYLTIVYSHNGEIWEISDYYLEK